VSAFWSMDGVRGDGTVVHTCSQCPGDRPCPRQMAIPKDITRGTAASLVPLTAYCDVNWGSHGCMRERGHDGDCWCDCCECDPHDETSLERYGCVAGPPYYGTDTKFYGDDVKARGLPSHAQETDR
jgi:hypothetical protein